MAGRFGLAGLLLLGLLGVLLVSPAVFGGTAGAQRCVKCAEEEPGTEVEAQFLAIHISGSGTVKNSTTGASYCATAASATNAATKTCEIELAEGKAVSLSAEPGPGSSFSGWTESGCSGKGTCSVTMTGPKSVKATFVDSTPPVPPGITAPSIGEVLQSTTGGAASISFDRNGDSSAASFLCRIDVNSSSGASACTSPWSTGALSTAAHTVYVWAKDANGNISTASARQFKVVNLPDTILSGTPAQGAVVTQRTTAFTYITTVVGSDFLCRLNGEIRPCQDLGPLADGAYVLTVAAGINPFEPTTFYYDASPASRSWTVDTVAPDTSISSGPGVATTETDASFAFEGTDPAPGTALSYECRLDAGDWAPCASGMAYPVVSTGSHAFAVRAKDAAGNLDSTPASRSWTVIADADGDAIFTPADCDDANPAIRPGAVDVPGDRIDQDCSGADAVAPISSSGNDNQGGNGGSNGNGDQGNQVGSPGARLIARWHVAGVRTTVRKLVLAQLPPAARVSIRCKGPGCPFKSKKLTARKGRASLTRLLSRATLRRGAVITLRITAAGRQPETIKLKTRTGKPPKRTVA